MFGSLGIPELLICAIAIVGFFLWTGILVDAATKERAESQDRLIWVLIVLLGGPVGALIYLIVRRPKRKSELGI